MKNKQVSQEIRYKIMSGEYPLHGTIPPERELTQIFGVSRVTIRSALQRLVEEGVLERNGRCGTVVKNIPLPERQKNSNQKKTILYVYFSSLTDKRTEQSAKEGMTYLGVETFANSHGFSLMVQSEYNYLQNGVPAFVDGVIMGGKDLLEHLPEVRSKGIPVVALSLIPAAHVDMVCWDDFGAGSSAALRAAQLGHKNILLTVLRYDDEKYLQPSFRRRIAGFMDQAFESGLSVKKYVYTEEKLADPAALQKKLAGLREKSGCTLTVDCSGQNPAVFRGSPVISIGALLLTENPETDFFYCDQERIGYLAAKRLAAVMNNPGLERLRLLVPIKTKFVLSKLKKG